MRPSTWILWIFPPILLILLLIGWLYKAKKGRTLDADDVASLTPSEQAKVDALLAKHQTSDQTSDKDKS